MLQLPKYPHSKKNLETNLSIAADDDLFSPEHDVSGSFQPETCYRAERQLQTCHSLFSFNSRVQNRLATTVQVVKLRLKVKQKT